MEEKELMAAYSFVTVWNIRAPRERVWDALNTPEEYPRWWPNIISYQKLNPEVIGVGARARRVVKGKLPYTLNYETVITKMEKPGEIAYDATGELVGKGKFVLTEQGPSATQVIFYWDVNTSGFWMNLLAPFLKWLFAWNHNSVMAQGEKGLAAWVQRPVSNVA
jgi:uncharacterized protein YndB with AHSA1/START domain